MIASPFAKGRLRGISGAAWVGKDNRRRGRGGVELKKRLLTIDKYYL